MDIDYGELCTNTNFWQSRSSLCLVPCSSGSVDNRAVFSASSPTVVELWAIMHAVVSASSPAVVDLWAIVHALVSASSSAVVDL